MIEPMMMGNKIMVAAEWHSAVYFRFRLDSALETPESGVGAGNMNYGFGVGMAIGLVTLIATIRSFLLPGPELRVRNWAPA